MPTFDPQSHPVVFAAASDQDLSELKKMVDELVNAAKSDFSKEIEKIDDETDIEYKQELQRRGHPNPIDESKTLDDDEFEDIIDDGEEEEEEEEEVEEEDEEEEKKCDEGNENDKKKVSLRLWQQNDAILVEAAQSAIRSNNIEALKVILESGAVITGPSLVSGGTVIHAAVEYDNEEILSYLLKEKADGGAGLKAFINDPEGTDLFSTPLHWAAIRGVTNCCEILIKNGCHKNARNKDKYTALLLALAQSKEETFEKLLELGCDPNIKNEDSHTCLHLAIGEMENENIAKILIKSGKCDLGAKDIVGWTPLALAVTESNTEIVKLLLEAGSPITYGEEEKNKVKDDGDDDGDDEQEELDEDSADLPLISIAAKNGQVEIVELLLLHRKEDVEVDLTRKDRLGKTPLDWSAKGPKKSREEILRLLYGAGLRKRDRED